MNQLQSFAESLEVFALSIAGKIGGFVRPYYQAGATFLRKHHWLILAALFVFGVAIVFSRNPDAFLHPQFWAEDGKYWYGDAYNEGGLHSLFMPYAGSLQLMTRFMGSLSLLLPLEVVPLFFMLVAVTIQILPVVLINTRRFAKLIPHVGARLLI